MPTACGYAWSNELDDIIRQETVAAIVRYDLTLTYIAVESGFNPAARNYNPPIEDSVGLLQLNRIGGQGAGYSVEQLRDPRFNLRVGLPAIARAYGQIWNAGLEPYEFIYQLSVRSGHPGMVARDDPRIQRIFQVWTCFGSGVISRGWPTVELAALAVPGGVGLARVALALFAPGIAGLPGSVLAGGFADWGMASLRATGRQAAREMVWRFGPRTILRRQLRALTPGDLRSRFIAALDPRVRLMRALRLPFPLSTVRLAPRHHWHRF